MIRCVGLLLLVSCGPTGQRGGETGGYVDTGAYGDADTDTDTDDALDPDDLPAGASPCREPVLVLVDYVYDGDTVYAAPVDGGPEEAIRLIGVDTPEISSDDCWAEEARAFTRERLLDERVWLTFDAECTDRYDRTLAYAHTSDAADGFHNHQLLRTGQGTVMAIEPNTTFESSFRTAERDARDEGLGLWGGCR